MTKLSRSRSSTTQGDTTTSGAKGRGKGKGSKKSNKSKSWRAKLSRSKTPREKKSKSKSKSLDKKTKSTQNTRSTATGIQSSNGSSRRKKNSKLCGFRSKTRQGLRSGKSSKSRKSRRSQKSGKSSKSGGFCGRRKAKKSQSERSKPMQFSSGRNRKKRSKGRKRRLSSQSVSEHERLPMICSYWPRATSSRNTHRIIAVVRSAERVDRVFGSNWLKTEAPHGYLVPTDLNVPKNSISEKFLDEGVFVGNPPITSFGKYYTQLTGRALCNRGLSAKLLICSPTLRSIQTAESLARFLKANLAIEPGLVEPLAWYRSASKTLPNFRIEELARIYPIDTSYSPIISMEALSKMFEKESEMQGIQRIDFVLRSLAGEQRSESLVVIGHAITLAVAVALTRPKENTEKERSNSSQTSTTSSNWYGSVDMLEGEIIDRVNLGLRYPPGSAVALHQVNKGPPYLYQLCPGVVPPLSYGEMYSSKPIVETIVY